MVKPWVGRGHSYTMAGAISLVLLTAGAVGPGAAMAQALDSTTYPARRAYTHDLRISAPYDPEHNKTVLQTERMELTPTLAMSALSALDGRTVTKPADGVVLTFWSTATPAQFAADRAVQLVLNDSVTLDLGKAWLTPNPAPGFVEVMLTSVSVSRFLALANARTARIRIGATGVRLPASIHDGLRDFASRMAPGAAR